MAVIWAAIQADIEFSLTMTRNPRITRTIASIDEQEWIPVHYPGDNRKVNMAEVLKVAGR